MEALIGFCSLSIRRQGLIAVFALDLCFCAKGGRTLQRVTFVCVYVAVLAWLTELVRHLLMFASFYVLLAGHVSYDGHHSG